MTQVKFNYQGMIHILWAMGRKGPFSVEQAVTHAPLFIKMRESRPGVGTVVSIDLEDADVAFLKSTLSSTQVRGDRVEAAYWAYRSLYSNDVIEPSETEPTGGTPSNPRIRSIL